MKFLKLRVGVLATVSGLVLMTAGVATAQAQGSTRGEQDHASQGDNKVCVSWESGDVWQTRSPDGRGWHKQKGHSRVIPEVPEVDGQAFVAAVEGVPAIPKIEHAEYQYERTVDDAVVRSGWLLEAPAPDAGPAWEQTSTRQVTTQQAVPEVFAVPEVPFIAAAEEIPAYTEYHWTRAAKDCKGDKHRHDKGDKHRHHKGDKNCKDESHDSDHSPATPPPATTPPVTPTVTKTVAKPIVVAPAKAAVPVVVSPAEAAVNPLPVSADAGQADTSGQLAAAGLAGFAAFLALGAGFVLRRRRSDV